MYYPEGDKISWYDSNGYILWGQVDGYDANGPYIERDGLRIPISLLQRIANSYLSGQDVGFGDPQQLTFLADVYWPAVLAAASKLPKPPSDSSSKIASPPPVNPILGPPKTTPTLTDREPDRVAYNNFHHVDLSKVPTTVANSWPGQFLSGAVSEIWNMASGFFHAVTHPSETLEALAALADKDVRDALIAAGEAELAAAANGCGESAGNSRGARRVVRGTSPSRRGNLRMQRLARVVQRGNREQHVASWGDARPLLPDARKHLRRSRACQPAGYFGTIPKKPTRRLTVLESARVRGVFVSDTEKDSKLPRVNRSAR